MTELSEHDKALLEKASEDAKKRTKAFFGAHGVSDVAEQLGRLAYKKFMENHREVERKLGKSFFHSPLAMKAFVMGWWYGRGKP